MKMILLFLMISSFRALTFAADTSNICFNIDADFDQEWVQILDLNQQPTAFCLYENEGGKTLTLLMNSTAVGQFVIAKESVASSVDTIDTSFFVISYRNIWKHIDTPMNEKIRIIASRKNSFSHFAGLVFFGDSDLQGPNTFHINEIR